MPYRSMPLRYFIKRRKPNTSVLGKVIIHHSEVENHRRLSSCNKPELFIIINIPTYRGIFLKMIVMHSC
jgi:hypothetical protein